MIGAGRARSITASLLLGALVAGAVLLASTRAYAYPIHRRYFRIAYDRATGCTLCHGHGGGTERNPYGRDWHERGENVAAFRAVEALDSDEDGTSNVEEIRAGSNPGDAQSTPAQPGASWTNDAPHLAIPTEQLDLVLEGYDRIEASEISLTDEQAREVERGAGGRLRAEDRYPTLYFAVREGRRDAVALFVDAERSGTHYTMLISAALDGSISGVALFRSGDDPGTTYLPYLQCLRGHARSDIPAPGEAGCPRAAGREAVQQAMASAVKRALWTLSVVLAATDTATATATATDTATATATETATATATATATEAAPAPLDLDRVPTTDSIDPMPSGPATAYTLASILLLLTLITLSVRTAMRLGANKTTTSRLETLSPTLRLLSAMLVLSLLVVQALAVSAVIMHTQVVHPSTEAYFQSLTWQRLLGTSHSHVFGYAVMYGLLAWLASLSSAREIVKCALVAALFWGGIADVASWWAIKALSPRFEWLTLTSGAITATASLIAAVVILRSLLRAAGSSPPGSAA